MVIDASLLEFSKCMIKYCKNLMTRLQSNKYMTELSLCTDTGRKWNKKATIPYRMKDINCLCLLHILEENMLLPNLPLLETGWNSLVLLKMASVLIMLYSLLEYFESTHVYVFGIWSIALKWKKNQQMSLINQ